MITKSDWSATVTSTFVGIHLSTLYVCFHIMLMYTWHSSKQLTTCREMTNET